MPLKKLKILHTVESYSPLVHGMQEVVKQLSERLVDLGHEVHVATRSHPLREPISVLNGVHVHSFDISGNSVYGIKASTDEAYRYQQFIIDGDFDIVTNFAAQQWATDLSYPILNRVKGKKIYVPTGYSMLYDRDFVGYYKEMPGWLDRYDKIVYLSDDYRDSNFAREHKKTNGVIIPNGAAREEFESLETDNIKSSLGIPNEHQVILLVGGHTGAKGHREALELFDRLEVENTTLVILGEAIEKQTKRFGNIKLQNKGLMTRFKVFLQESGIKGFLKGLRDLGKKKYLPNLIYNCPGCCTQAEFFLNKKKSWKKSSKRVIIDSLPRNKVVSLFKESTWFLLPSQIECSPIVIFEALSAGLPFMSTDVGNCAEIAGKSQAGFILPTNKVGVLSHLDVESAAKYIEETVFKADYKQLKENARKFWLSGHTWDQITKEYEKVYTSET